MKKIYLSALTIAICLCSCMSHEDADFSEQDNAAIKENAEKIFGNIDPSQNWSSIKKGTINITADAPLTDIVKVQILTESPFGNDNATVLNESEIKNNGKVEMVFDAPNIYNVLFAACVDKNGAYYVKAFNIGDKEVSFAETANARMTRGIEAEAYPNLSSIVLGEPVKSINALRATDAQTAKNDNGDKYILINDKEDGKGSNRRYTNWNDGSWLNDYLYSPVDASSNGWTIEKGTIHQPVTDNVDLTTLQWLVKYYLPKKDGEIVTTGGNKTNNWKSLVEGTNYFKLYKNHFVSDGQPLTIIPLQMNTTEGAYNAIYYYYFDSTKIAGKSDAQIAEFIKSLPKYKALNGYKGDDGKFHRDTKYLLPFYGDEKNPKAIAIPAGYYIGFMNQKSKNTSVNQCLNGCTYGFGPLNEENNHIIGHYFSALSTDITQQSIKDMGTKTETQTKNGSTPYGMTWDSPRIGIFSANNKVFLCFEDGADCNFSDMVIEISSGVKVNIDPIKPEAAAYTMSFEDRLETADYDMNDVVLRGIRLNDSQIQITLIACGADDELQIQGLYNSKKLTTKEVHKFFNVVPGSEFINTEKGAKYFEPVSETFNIDKSVNLEDFMKKIYIKNLTTKKEIAVPKNGEPPYAIIVPQDFNYPVERCSIIKAYPLFKNWAQNMAVDTDWYKTPVDNLIYPNKFAQTAE